MSATTVITGTIPTDFARSLSSPDEGSEVKAGDVRTGEQALLNNDKLLCDGNPTINGALTLSGTNIVGTTTALTVTSPGGAAVITTAGGNGQGLLAHSSGNGAAVQGTATGANGNGGLFISSGGADAVVALATAGDANGITATAHGQGAGGNFTGGTTNGHGAVGTAGGAGASGLKGVAFAAADVAVWASGGSILLDTGSPPTPGANTIFADKLVAATGAVAITSAGTGIPTPSGSFLNCTVDVAPGDTTVIEVKFKTNMASGAYVVVYGEAEFSTPGTVYKAVTVQSTKSGGGFNLRMRNTATGVDVDFAAVAGTWAFDFVVVGRQ